MRFALPKIYPITDVGLTNLTHVEQVKRLAEGGATFIQLRDKHAAPNEFYEAAREAMNYARGSEIKIIINDRVDIALAARADGVHLGQNDLPPAEARRILGERAIIGYSTHNIGQAAEAAQMPLDYIAVGPIFATQSKADPDPVVGLEGLQIVRAAIGDFPLVAIGGISFETTPAILRHGADSVALIGALLKPAANITENVSHFVKHL